ncbi:acyl carrier protein [Klebsiella pneumoniae]|uniref:hypothetical protein n=1 Tax=Enterobacteriaceae TaxID=543 RepID=UPI000665C2E0|nr:MULTISPECIES: hypothetical protein [Enterobacteriaceae]MBD3695569.1 acyl carrier protein [Klebsiella pneumoniae]MBD3697632.1 acyl carrier protein [Klebsiella pneumoniae]MBD3703200.1 acyl carrier protein [Klebsiella pneumoniae]MCZ9381388.1 hypothetical protein [Klebsiella pneumoniae]OVH09328.1 hypothetical protein B8Z90_05710 [Klebsiella pneumoniae]
MKIEDFCNLVSNETGLDIDIGVISASFDSIEGWSSIMILMIANGFQRETGKKPSLPKLLKAGSLQELWVAATSE